MRLKFKTMGRSAYYLDQLGYNDNEDELNEYQILRKINNHNVMKDRAKIYKDFCMALLYYVNDTYLGSDYISSKKDIVGHFNWCYFETLKLFFEEEIDFYSNEELHDYFLRFYMIEFYEKEGKGAKTKIQNIFNEIFDLSKTKKSKNFNVMLEIYSIFDESIKSKFDKPNLIDLD
jgi:hypothetical protein